MIISFKDKATTDLYHGRETKGDLSGYHSIRVNEQWRIIFQWDDNNARDVSLTDYH
jgi:proteic killer suppression protein